MKATLCLEYLGEGFAGYERLMSTKMDIASGGDDRGAGIASRRKPWVAEITGVDDKFGFARSFLPEANWQRKRSSSTGNRGTELWFILEAGRIYDVKHYVSWRNPRRYFVTVSDHGDIVERDLEWVRSRLVLMSSPPQGIA